MLGFDFHIFWQAAGTIIQGQSPYAIAGFFSPFPLALLLVPFSLLPFPIAYVIWTAGKISLILNIKDPWSIFKILLFFPVTFDLMQGQIDLLVFAVLMKTSWQGVVISSLRPQLAIWIIPFSVWHWWRQKKYNQIWKAIAGIASLYGLAIVFAPGWWVEWFNAPKIAWFYNQQSASLFGLATVLPCSHATAFISISILALVSFVWLRPNHPRTYWQWVAFFNPIAHIYSLAVLYDQVDWTVVVLSLIALPASAMSHTNAVWALIPLYLFLKDHKSTIKRATILSTKVY